MGYSFYVNRFILRCILAHKTARKGYQELGERINRFPLGAHVSESLFKILSVLMTEKEASELALLPVKPIGVKQASFIWKVSEVEAAKKLEKFADKMLLMDMDINGEMQYVLPPPMAGFFEFSMMRTRGDVDQGILSELFHQYISVEDDFVKSLFTGGKTQFGRIFVNEEVLPDDNSLYVFDYERSTEVIKTADTLAVSMCYCRHVQQHRGQACDAPMDICMTFGDVAESLIRHGYARRIDDVEGIDLLQKGYEHNLVQFGENAQNEVSFLCHCCGCCCEALQTARKFGLMNPVHTTNFIPEINTVSCTGCNKCAQACPVEAIGMVSANDSQNPKRTFAKLDERICLGCGVCVRVCRNGSIRMKARDKRVITPVNSVHKYVLMAIERGKLQNLIFDNKAHMSHRAMAAVFGAVLKLEPVKRVLASEQIGSRYLGRLIEKKFSSLGDL
jgi:ferredoxin